jgi:hypothetical protein
LATSYELKHIEIDKTDLIKTFDWLIRIQNSTDGSFPQVGAQLLSKGLAGGLGNNKKTGLTAYVLSTLLITSRAVDLDSNELGAIESIKRGLDGLQQALGNFDSIDTYTLAMSFYVSSLSY